jgi:hypothetical protein
MTVYEYIAESNPAIALGIIEQLGYQHTGGTLGNSLKEMVSKEGEPALKLILANHPDRDIIIEMFGKTEPSIIPECEICKEKKIVEKYLGTNGIATTSEAKTVENNFSLIFLAGVTILAFAIIKK